MALTHEFSRAFDSLALWKGWLSTNAWCMDPAYVDGMVATIREAGLADPIYGYSAPEEISFGEPYQESLLYLNINARQRALTLAIMREGLDRDSSVYASENITPLSNSLRKMFPNFIGSEYLPTQEDRDRWPGVRHENVEALSFGNGALDAYISSGVLEHIPNVPKAINEAARVLRKGGVFLAYFPFRLVDEDTQIKAVMNGDGSTTMLTEPEYHGDPVAAGGKGVLVYSIPGWDILKLARSAGFAQAEMVAIISRAHGILSQHAPAPVLIMRAVK